MNGVTVSDADEALAPVNRPSGGTLVPGHYMVKLKDHCELVVDPDDGETFKAVQRARRNGITVERVLTAVKLYSAHLSADELLIARRDPDVKYIEQNTENRYLPAPGTASPEGRLDRPPAD
jgi:hypothetical protein